MAGEPFGFLARMKAWYQTVPVVIVFFIASYSWGKKSQFRLNMFLMKE